MTKTKTKTKTKTMTFQQINLLKSWCMKLIVTYHIDFFRGSTLVYTMQAIYHRTVANIEQAKGDIRVAEYYEFKADTKDYDDLLKELRQIAKEVPLDNKALTVIKRIFSGDWKGSIEALHNLNSAYKKTDFDMFGYLW